MKHLFKTNPRRVVATVTDSCTSQRIPNSKRKKQFQSRSFSSLCWWTAATYLVGATTTKSSTKPWVSGPLASALAIHGSAIGVARSNTRTNRGSSLNLSATRKHTDSSSRSFTSHSSLSELLREFDYDALILDQFGVLHNGKHALEGTIDCVNRIATGGESNDNDIPNNSKDKKLQLIVLSNTSSPSKTTLDRLQTKLGFERSYFCGAVTSGEEAARHIRETYGTLRNDETGKRRFVWCTWDPSNENVPDPIAFLELCGPNVEPTVDVSSADFVVAHGSGAIRGFGKDRGNGNHEIVPMGSFLDDGNLAEGTPISTLLESCASRNLPLICANPDEVVQYHDGSLKHMPGKIALRYREILEARDRDEESPSPSSLITIYGKPHSEHFEACLRELEEDRKRKKAVQRPDSKHRDEPNEFVPLRVAHVGDSLHHDIAGANAAGIPSIFIVGGIHAEELLSPEDSVRMPSEERLRSLFDREGITPTHVLPVFNY